MKIPALHEAGGDFFIQEIKERHSEASLASEKLAGDFFYPKIFHTFEAEEKTSN